MSAPRSLRRNISWTLAGNVVYTGAQWGILVALAKLGDPAMVGRFTLGLAVATPVVLFTNMGLRAVQATDARREFAFRDYLALRLIAMPVTLAILTTEVMLSGYSREATIVVLAVGATKIVESCGDIFYGLFQQREHMQLIARSMMLKGPLSLLALGIGVGATGELLPGVLAMLGVWLGVLLLFDLVNARRLLAETGQAMRPDWQWPTLRRLARMAAPLGIATVLGSLLLNVPRYFVEHHGGEAELGIFAALGYVMVAGSTVVAALGEAASPRLAQHFQSDLAAYRRLLGKLLLLGAALGALGLALSAVAARPILDLMYGPAYAAQSTTFLWLMLAGGVNYILWFALYGLNASRSFREQLVLRAAAIASMAISCALLVERHGIRGAAWAQGAITGLQLVAALGLLARAMRLQRAVLAHGLPSPVVSS